jgi:hypothetical protein
MSAEKRACIDCGKKFEPSEFWGIRVGSFGGESARICRACLPGWQECARCHQATRLEDMSQAYCRSCRRQYDRDRWARQRAARGA